MAMDLRRTEKRPAHPARRPKHTTATTTDRPPRLTSNCRTSPQTDLRITARPLGVQLGAKTKRNRTVSLDPATVGLLRQHLADMDERAATCGVTVTEDGFVFSLDPTCRTPMRPELMTRRMRQLRKTLGIRPGEFDGTILALRKWTSTELMDAGFNPSPSAADKGTPSKSCWPITPPAAAPPTKPPPNTSAPKSTAPRKTPTPPDRRHGTPVGLDGPARTGPLRKHVLHWQPTPMTSSEPEMGRRKRLAAVIDPPQLSWLAEAAATAR